MAKMKTAMTVNLAAVTAFLHVITYKYSLNVINAINITYK